MDLNKYTQKSQEAILNAQHITQDYSHQSIEPAHLLLSLLKQDENGKFKKLRTLLSNDGDNLVFTASYCN